MKKIFALILTILCIVSIVTPLVALAEEAAAPDAPVTDAGITVEVAQPIDPADVSWLNTYIDYVIVGICVVIGLLVKHCTPLDNKYIPLIVAVVGLLIAVWTHWSDGITPTVILGGLFSGLASTGFHQVFKQLFFSENK